MGIMMRSKCKSKSKGLELRGQLPEIPAETNQVLRFAGSLKQALLHGCAAWPCSLVDSCSLCPGLADLAPQEGETVLWHQRMRGETGPEDKPRSADISLKSLKISLVFKTLVLHW